MSGRGTSRLLIDEPPLQVLPSLACELGLNEAIFVQQLHFWLRSKYAHEFEGKLWIYNTYEGWHEQFPFWSLGTVRRVITACEKRAVVESTTRFNARNGDRTKWYTLDYEELDVEEFSAGRQSNSTEQLRKVSGATAQSERTEVRNMSAALPETTQRVTTENKTTEVVEDPPTKSSEPSPTGGMFVRLFDEDLARFRDASPANSRSSLSGKWRKNLKRAADAELASGRDPHLLRQAVSRLAMRIDGYSGMELAEAINDVLGGKPFDQSGSSRSVQWGSRRQSDDGSDYSWWFGNNDESKEASG